MTSGLELFLEAPGVIGGYTTESMGSLFPQVYQQQTAARDNDVNLLGN